MGLKYVKMPRSVSEYSRMRGITDFSNTKQFDLFETGYGLLSVIGTPRFMNTYAKKDTKIANLQNSFVHVIEQEFRGLSGLGDITTTPGEINNGINTMGLINKVEYDTSVQIETTYYERSGLLLTRYLEEYLTGIKDPRSQAKTYHGLVGSSIFDPGPDYEVFTLLYTVLDNTMRRVEAAYLLANAQPLSVPYSTNHNITKGDINFSEVSIPWNCFPIQNDQVNMFAAMLLENDLAIATTDGAEDKDRALILDSNDYKYKILRTSGNYATPNITSSYKKIFNDEDRRSSVETNYSYGSGNNGFATPATLESLV